MATADDDLAGWLRLLLTPGIGNDSARRLLAAFGPPEAVLAQSATALRQVVTAAQAQALLTEPENWPAQLAATLAWRDGGPDRAIVALGDADYPPGLLALEDPPLLLYTRGTLRLAEARRALALVGSRNPTPQGASNARLFARSFSQAGVTVVSGLALGIDAAAHEGALEGPGGTVAVVGTGLDRVYPKQHLDLAHRIAAHGLLVSEFALGTPPLNHNFPRRNRLIAGLSEGTLVVEAALQSGSLITARLASEQGKDVFAIPGSIHSAQSRGCHALIKQGAKLVESAQDVLEELRWPAAAAPHASPALSAPAPSAVEDSLRAALGHDPVSLDALAARTGIPLAELQARLLDMELAGEVGRLPGGLFQRIAAG